MTAPTGSDRLARLSLNQRTIANATLAEAIAACRTAGLSSIGLWREPVAEVGLDQAEAMIKESGLRVSSLCRGGFFTAADPRDIERADRDNQAAIEETARLGAATLVLVPGGLPADDRDLAGARSRVITAIERLVPYAREHGVTLGIEPMNPIYAADRGVISTLAQALDIAERFEPTDVGVIVDTFHLWWEPGIEAQLGRAGDRILSYQISDWITPLPPDTLLARGMIGDGHIDFAGFTRAVAATGYAGDIEVEIFNADLWAQPYDDVLRTMSERYLGLVEGFLSPI